MFRYINSLLPQQKQRLWFWVVMLILLSLYPYKIANAYYPFIVSNIQTQFIIAILLTSIVLLIKRKTLPKEFWICVWMMVFGSVLHYFLTGDKFYYHKLINLEAAVCLIIIVYSKIGYRPFFTIYNKWILLIAVFAAFAFFIINANVPPIRRFIATEDGREMSNWIISFAKTGGTLINRPSGMFDEPGALGYWGCFALGINKLFIKDEKLEKILLIALIFTMSMGYYMQAIAYLVLFLIKGSSATKKFSMLSITFIIIISLISLKGTQYNDIYESSIGRIETMFNSDNILSMEGTTRERLVEESKKKFEENPIFGIGWPVDDELYIGDNHYETLAHDGILGTIYQYFPYILLLFWGIKRKDIEVVFVVIFLALAVFHRPIHSNILTYFIYYSLPLIYWIKIQEDKQKKLI